MVTKNYTLTRDDDDIELELCYEVAPLIPARLSGPPEDCYPAEGGEIEELSIFGPDGAEFTVTDAELKAIEDHIYQTHDYNED